MAADPLTLKTLVAVEWVDAHASITREQTIEEAADEQPTIYTTYGLLVRNDEQFVAVASEVREGSIYRGISYIPRGMVMRVIAKDHRPRHKRVPCPDAVPVTDHLTFE